MNLITKKQIDVVDENSKRLTTVRAGASSTEVKNKVKRLGITKYSDFQMSTYTNEAGNRVDCWKPSQRSLATLISLTHNL